MTKAMIWSASDALLPASFPMPTAHPFTTAQARARGISGRRLQMLHDSGHLRRLLRGVYASAQAPDDLRFRAAAVSLVVPRQAVVTDRTAAWLHGVPILPRTALREVPPIEVFRTDDARVRRPGVTGGRRGLLARDVMEVYGVRVTTPARTALDLGRMLWRYDALAALDGFLRRGVDREALLRDLSRFRGYRGVRQLRPLLLIADRRAESPGESALRLHWYDAGLPEPTLQHWIDGDDGIPRYRLDLALPELRYAAEYDGELHHSSPDDRADDEERRSWARRRGWTIDVFLKEDVYGLSPRAPDRLRAGQVQARRTLPIWHPGEPGPE